MANLNNECSCRGEYPNCLRCEGTGVFKDLSNYSVKGNSKKAKIMTSLLFRQKAAEKEESQN